MFGKRYDGRRVRNIDPFMRIMPYIMKTRSDAYVMFEESGNCEGMDAYIKQKKELGIEFSYIHIIIASIVRILALRPQLNRFVMNGKIYTRPKIWVCFAVHHSLRGETAETTVKLCFEGTETLEQVAKMVDDAIERETVNHEGDNSTDKLAKLIMSIPGPLIRFVVNTLMFMDRHNMLPKSIIEASPFHTSVFLTNLKSLGINHVFHHIYEFGTTGLFLAVGKEKKLPVSKEEEISTQKHLGYGLVADERICDGLYFARALKMLKRYMKDPSLLEDSLDAKVEDVK